MHDYPSQIMARVGDVTAASGVGLVLFGQAASDPHVAAGGVQALVLGLIFLGARAAVDYLADRLRNRKAKLDAERAESARLRDEVESLRARLRNQPRIYQAGESIADFGNEQGGPPKGA